MLHGFYDDLLFSPEWMKIKKVEKFVGNLYDKKEYVSHIWNLKKAWIHETILKKKCIELLNTLKQVVKIIHWYGHRAKEERKRWFLGIFFKN